MRIPGLICILLLVLLACSLGGGAVTVPTALPTIAPSFTPIPSLTSPPAATATLQATSQKTFQPFTIFTSADNVALRKGPGYLFQRIGLLPKGTSLMVLGQSRGGEWALARTMDGRVGWIFVQLVDAGGNSWTSVPFSEPLGAQLVTGVVKDEAGVLISGVQFAFTQGTGPQTLRTDALTDASGTFYAYMPADVHGGWYLSYTAIACSSNVMDANCNPKNGVGGKPYPEGQFVTLPLSDSASLEFVWR